MKRTITILLALVFVYNTLGFLFIHPLLINYYKHLGMQEAAKPSAEELIELIILRKEDILFNKINYERIHSHEFRLNGKMYDIVKEVDKDSLIYFYCINDKKEEKLEKEFHKRVEENTANKKHRANDNNPLKTLTSEPVCYLTLDLMDAEGLAFKFQYDGNYLPVWGDVLTPPPKSLSVV